MLRLIPIGVLLLASSAFLIAQTTTQESRSVGKELDVWVSNTEGGPLAQSGCGPNKIGLLAENHVSSQSDHQPDQRTTPLDAQREKQALQIFLKSVQEQIVSAAEAMPATKYEF